MQLSGSDGKSQCKQVEGKYALDKSPGKKS